MTPEPQHERVRRLEETHWWFVTLRELVAHTITSRHPDGSKVLDAGCGTGRVLAEIPDTYERVGIDVNPEVLRLNPERPGIEFREASVMELPFEDDHFDVAYALDVVSDARVDDERAALRELARVVRPGGTVILNLPAYEWLKSGHDTVAQTERRYTAGQTAELLIASDVIPQITGYRVSAVFPLAAARRLLRREQEESDVEMPPEPINKALIALGRRENEFARHGKLPFGLSVYAVGRVHHSGRPDSSNKN